MTEIFRRTDGLLAPEQYWAFKNLGDSEEYAAVCNGMGPAGGNQATRLLTKFLSNKILWVDAKGAADIHDFMYFMQSGRRLSDELFLFNLFNLIGDGSSCIATRIPRKFIAAIYYICVFWFGGRAYKRAKDLDKKEAKEKP